MKVKKMYMKEANIYIIMMKIMTSIKENDIDINKNMRGMKK